MTMTELTSLPLAERLQAMETLWDSLCRDADFNPSPAWHAEVLQQRRAERDQGLNSPWDDAKARLRATIEPRS